MIHETTIASTRYFLRVGDIVAESTEAIVNAANSSLLGGGGVDGAIHRSGGPKILEECKIIRKKSGKCPPGEAVITSGGNLRAQFVIHTVGPFWNGGQRNEIEILRHCYVNSLMLARKHGIRSIAFPSIATGAYRFPVEKAAEIAQRAVLEEIRKDDFFTESGFVLFERSTFEAYDKALKNLLSQIYSY